MGWEERQEIYKGNSALYLSPDEASAVLLIVSLECTRWPYPSYSNREWHPDKSHYGRITSWHNGYCFGSQNIQFVATNLLYRQDDYKLLRGWLLPGLDWIGEEVAEEMPPWAILSLYNFLIWLIVRTPDAPPDLSTLYPAMGHTPTEWRLTTRPDAEFLWRVRHWSSDLDIAQGSDADPPGAPGAGPSGSGPDGGPPDSPPGESSTGGLLSSIPDGAPANDFSPQDDDGGFEIPWTIIKFAGTVHNGTSSGVPGAEDHYKYPGRAVEGDYSTVDEAVVGNLSYAQIVRASSMGMSGSCRIQSTVQWWAGTVSVSFEVVEGEPMDVAKLASCV